MTNLWSECFSKCIRNLSTVGKRFAQCWHLCFLSQWCARMCLRITEYLINVRWQWGQLNIPSWFLCVSTWSFSIVPWRKSCLHIGHSKTCLFSANPNRYNVILIKSPLIDLLFRLEVIDLLPLCVFRWPDNAELFINRFKQILHGSGFWSSAPCAKQCCCNRIFVAKRL